MFSWMGLLQASIAGGLCIILYFLVSQLFGERYKARYKKIIWLLIGLRMCIPVSTSLLPPAFMVQMPVVVLGEWGGQKAADSSGALNDGAPGEEMLSDGNLSDTDLLSTAFAAEGEKADSKVKGEGINIFGFAAGSGQITSQDILMLLWVCGSAGVLLYYLLVHFLFCRKMMKKSVECTDETILTTVSEISEEMGLKRVPRVRLVRDAQISPFTVGFFANIVFIPEKSYQERDLQYIIRHELVHCAGKDTQIKTLFVIVSALHWFNPLAWFMKSMAAQDIELACDERVLSDTSKEERSEYSEVLMACINAGGTGSSAFSTGYVQGVKFIKKRFRNIFNTGKKGSIAGVCVFAVLLTAVSASVGFEAGRMVYARGGIKIDSGIELRTDVTGNGVPDQVLIYDDTSFLTTSIILHTADGREAFYRYEDDMWASSYLVSGDLSGNGTADIVVMRISNGMHGTGEVAVLYAEEESGEIRWKEYPRKFISNPAIEMEQWGDFDNVPIGYVGATIIEKDGRHLLRLISIDEKTSDEAGIIDEDTVVCMDCSWQGEGWLIEDMQVVSGYYSENKADELLKNNIYSGQE